MSEELKLCPFCGAGETIIDTGTRVWLGTRYSEPSSVSVKHWCDKIEGQPSRIIERIGRDEQSAVAAWNRRATTTPAVEKEASGDAPAQSGGEPVAYANARHLAEKMASIPAFRDRTEYYDVPLFTARPAQTDRVDRIDEHGYAALEGDEMTNNGDPS